MQSEFDTSEEIAMVTQFAWCMAVRLGLESRNRAYAGGQCVFILLRWCVDIALCFIQ